MKLWLYALGMCQSMFCAIPFPWHGWEEKARDKMLLCLPVIGLEIGAIWWCIAQFCRILALPAPVAAFTLCAAPYLLTGFMHLDGFMDVTDAVRSYRSLERRREILKDSHVGSFAVIAVALLMLGQFSACLSLPESADYGALVLIPVVSRCASVIAIGCLKPMETSQYIHRKMSPALPLGMLAVTFGVSLFVGAWLPVLAVLAGYGLALLRAYRSLQGMNGDISGYCICLGELAGLVALVLT